MSSATGAWPLAPTRIGEQNVDRPVPLDGGGDDGLAVASLFHVACHEGDPTIGRRISRRNFGDRLGPLLRVATVDHGVGTLPEERLSGTTADPSSAARDAGDLPVQHAHGTPCDLDPGERY